MLIAIDDTMIWLFCLMFLLLFFFPALTGARYPERREYIGKCIKTLRPPVWQIKFEFSFFIWFYGRFAEIAHIDGNYFEIYSKNHCPYAIMLSIFSEKYVKMVEAAL